jgi:hypothetical protein
MTVEQRMSILLFKARRELLGLQDGTSHVTIVGVGDISAEIVMPPATVTQG